MSKAIKKQIEATGSYINDHPEWKRLIELKIEHVCEYFAIRGYKVSLENISHTNNERWNIPEFWNKWFVVLEENPNLCIYQHDDKFYLYVLGS